MKKKYITHSYLTHMYTQSFFPENIFFFITVTWDKKQKAAALNNTTEVPSQKSP